MIVSRSRIGGPPSLTPPSTTLETPANAGKDETQSFTVDSSQAGRYIILTPSGEILTETRYAAVAARTLSDLNQ